jgi:hypothetical protein
MTLPIDHHDAPSGPGGEIILSPRTNVLASRNQAAYFEVTVKNSQGLLVPNQEVKIALQPATGGLILKPLGIGPGQQIGITTPTSAAAKTDSAGVVGIAIEIDPASGQSQTNILKLSASTTLKDFGGPPLPTISAVAQLKVLAQQ